MTTLPRTALAAGLALAALAAAAQAPAPPAAPPREPYRSVFEGYRGFAEQPLSPWRASNDSVGRIGGWRAYARESQGEAAPALKPALPGVSAGPAASAPKPAPRTGGHAEHHR